VLTCAWGETHQGYKRSNNEDFFLTEGETPAPDDSPLYIVCDGMGGHAAGEVASYLAANALRRELHASGWLHRPGGQPEAAAAAMRRAVVQAHDKVRAESERRHLITHMGTTAVAALMLAECAVIASVGDSRAYLVTPDHWMQVTEDHTVAQLYAERGLITREAARRHPLRNVLLRSVGSPQGCEPDLRIVPMEIGDRLVLCTDGLTEMVPEPEIIRAVQSGTDTNAISHELVAQALSAGGLDNITVVVVERKE
jgi:protein phosphatase